MVIKDLIENLPKEDNFQNKTRPYFNHSVEFKKNFTAQKRAEMLEKVGLNAFFFPSEMVTGCDFLSDSGTTSMTNEQWASLHKGDESYGSNKGFFLLREQILETFGKDFFNDPTLGKPNAFIFHQARAGENTLFTLVGKLGQNMIIPNNGHFDTTEANIKSNKIEALNLFSPDLHDPNSKSKFKGNMNIEKLKELIEKSKDRIPMVYLTITNNTGGGQPVSMANIKEVSRISHENNLPLLLDACRFAENAWFIKNYEEGYKDKSVKEIIKEIFSYSDGFSVSFKKDGLVNMGGGLFLKDEGLFIKRYPSIPENLTNLQILKEGHPTYGGMNGRDILALVEGLKVVVTEEYLDHRIKQVQYFGEKMHEAGLPVLMPIGGHAVYLDMNKFFEGTNMKPEDFGGISFAAILLAAYGHRVCELGNFAFGSYDKETGKETFPEVNFIRFAIPRLRYEKEDLDSVVEAIKNLYENKNLIPPVEVTYGKDLTLRHFKARFKFKE